MTDLNQVLLCGRLGADPEIRTLQSGGRVANFRIATGDSWRDKNTGERKERTEWHSIVVWNEGLVGVVEQYLRKGQQIIIRGKLQTRKWQDQQGQDRYSTEVVLQGFDGFLQMVGGQQNSGGNSSAAPANQQNQYAAQSGRAAPPAGSGQPDYSRDLDDEVPF